MFLQFLETRPDKAISDAINKVRADADKRWEPMTFGGRWPAAGQYGLAELRPDHVGITDTYGEWENDAQLSAGWTTDINTSVDDDAYLVITGIMNKSADPKVAEFQITAGGTDYPCDNLEEIYVLDMKRAYFPVPIICYPKDPLKVAWRATAIVAAGAELIGLLGYCVGKQSYLIKQTY